MNNKSVLGYSKGSPYRNNPFLDINTPQGLIDMSNTDIPLYAQDETGYGKFLPPYSGMHQFNGSTVREVPVKQMGGLTAGQFMKQKRYMQMGGSSYHPRILPPTASSTYVQKATPPPVSVPMKRDLPIYKDRQNTEQLKKYLTYNDVPNKSSVDTAGYLAARELLTNHGSPNVLMQGNPQDIGTYQGRPRYDPISNTVHLHNPAYSIMWNNLGHDLITETAHAAQMQDRNKPALPLWFIQDWANHPYISPKGYDDTEYDTPGSLEYDAHKVIEPKLQKEFTKTFVDISNSVPDGSSYLQKYGVNQPIKQMGGMQDAYDFLFEDDADSPKKSEEKQTVTAPSTGEMGVDQRQQQQQLLEDEQNQLALSQANYRPTDYFSMFGLQNPNSFEGDSEVMGGPIGANGPAPSGPVNPNAPAQSSGKYGADHIGQYGHQIINQLSTDLGYSPNLNSIYRDPAQQASLVKQGVGVPNSWHLTGDAVDLKPEDWNHLSKEQQGQFRSNYDVIYHNNHYHIEPKGKRMGRGGRFTPKY